MKLIETNNEKAKESLLKNYKEPQEAFILTSVQDFLNSTERAAMLQGELYDKTLNPTIKDRKIMYYDGEGNKVTSGDLTNNKLLHSKVPILVSQKISYLLSLPFTIQATNGELDENTGGSDGMGAGERKRKRTSLTKQLKPMDKVQIDGLSDEVEQRLASLYGAKFRRMIRRVARESIIKGISWIQVYYDEGELKHKRIPAEQVVPFWGDADHTELEAVVRYYEVAVYDDKGNKETLRKYEYHTSYGSWYYVYDKNTNSLKNDINVGLRSNVNGQRGHFDILGNEGEDGKSAVWGRIPFIPFKYNGDEVSLVQRVQSLVDEYDKTRSDLSNLLEDIPNSVKVVAGYQGTDAKEFLQNLNTFKVAFVQEGGGLTTEQADVNVDAIRSHYDQLQKDIFEAGSGVDFQDENLGVASGEALKYRYSGLDIDCREFSSELNASLQTFSWFYKMDMLYKGEAGEEILAQEEDYVFNTDVIINEGETITNVRNSLGIVSEETALSNHPWVTNLAEEMDRLAKEKEKAAQEEKDAQEDFMQYDFNKSSSTSKE